MVGILKDLQLLAFDHGLSAGADLQAEEVAAAIKAAAALSSSLPESLSEGIDFTATHSGSGAINQVRGQQHNNYGSGQIVTGDGHTMNFGSQEIPQKNEAQKCLRALFRSLRTDPCDDRDKLIQEKGARVEGKCSWIDSNELSKSWLESTSQLLWLSGGPGKGKTMLAIYLAEKLEQVTKASQNAVFLKFFCDNKDDSRNTAGSVIRGLLYQLVRLRPEMLYHILPTFKIQQESLFGASSFESLWRIFESMIRDPLLGTVHCVIDGLDECDPSSVEGLLKRFTNFFPAKSSAPTSCQLKIILISREFPDCIPEILSEFPRIRLDPDADREVNQDIHRFVITKVDDLSSRKGYPDSLRQHVKEAFLQRAQRTFLWVGIVAEMLNKSRWTEVQRALDLFPPGLNGLYTRMLLQIDNDRRPMAAKILRWVAMAVRPLTLSELSDAIVSREETRTDFTCDNVMRDRISYCGSILKVKKYQDEYEIKQVVTLIHQSVKDYLLRRACDPDPQVEYFRIEESIGNIGIARVCLDYLQNGALPAGPVNLMEEGLSSMNFPLLRYATVYWPEHARSVTHSDTLFNLSLPFWSKISQVRRSWLRRYSWLTNSRLDGKEDLLYLASWFGFLPLAEQLLSHGLANIAKRLIGVGHPDRGERKQALLCAAWRGHLAIVRLLLERGAYVDAMDRRGTTALYEAARGGHKEIVKLLLDNGANTDRRGGEEDATALYVASERGYRDTVQLLVERGANLEVSSRYDLTPLHAAVLNGDERLLSYFIEKRANIEANDMTGRAVLNAAARYGEWDIVRLLLEQGADTKSKDHSGIAALHHAVQACHEASVRLLIEKQAEVNGMMGTGETALHLAVSSKGRQRESLVCLLIEKGADIEAKNMHGESVLHLAAEIGSRHVIEVLLEFGADIEVKGKAGETALHVAATHWSQDAIEVLLGFEADLEAKNEHGETALHLAAEGGVYGVVKLLLGAGADPRVEDTNGEAALHLATARCHSAVIRLLHELGADPEVKNMNGETALHLAARWGRWVTIQLLLELGATPNVKNIIGNTALHLVVVEPSEDGLTRGTTAEKDCANSVWVLLMEGADPYAKNNKGKTPRDLAIDNKLDLAVEVFDTFSSNS